jgi:two-component system sensor histidine kinase TctE
LIFHRHYRIYEGTGERVKGNGIGLAIVADIVKDHNAQITISDAEAGGTIFSVHFPAIRDNE